jgi:hypothetical protein
MQELVLASQIVSDLPWMIYVSQSQKIPSLDRVRHKRILAPEDLVQLLIRICLRETDQRRVRGLATILIHDGRSGHCITLSEFLDDGFRFVYYDPWPVPSVLCKGCNRAGVEAASYDEEANLWTITVKELLSVIRGVMVPQAVSERWRLRDEAGADSAAARAQAVIEATVGGAL